MGICIWLREHKPGICNNLEGWDGVEGGREFQEGGDVCTPVADSYGCMAETSTILYFILQLKVNIFLKAKKKINKHFNFIIEEEAK